MTSKAIEKEYNALVDAYERAGGERSALSSKNTGRLVIHENKVLGKGNVPGIDLTTTETSTGVNVHLRIQDGARIARSLHLCFGVLPKKGLQEITMKVDSGRDSDVAVVAHCVFPNAVRVVHRMDAEINVGENARFDYRETHYHGDYGGIEVIPKARITVARGGVYRSAMTISEGLVGKLDYDFEVFCADDAVAELVVKAYGKGADEIKVWERIHLDGNGARGLAKSRLVLSDRATAEVKGETYGNAPNARGHIDCIELVNGTRAVARAIPIVSVSNDKAKVTHEAAIGSIDKKQLETLMARGLDENEAIDVIVGGILK